jgi:hypothetical protein
MRAGHGFDGQGDGQLRPREPAHDPERFDEALVGM